MHLQDFKVKGTESTSMHRKAGAVAKLESAMGAWKGRLLTVMDAIAPGRSTMPVPQDKSVITMRKKFQLQLNQNRAKLQGVHLRSATHIVAKFVFQSHRARVV